ncbi:MAG: 3-demethoxyubiquinol 3-hydroxylase [Candidatus Celerinatantimonas neptuna]|nr:MAG: 3-demethoxyubiquinol 3-hydroxylase [Candidatus Celerinatantimonas neptuna]
MEKEFDVIIAGGGMVGASLACGLAMQGFRVVILESHPPEAFNADSQPDIRLSAFSLGSEKLLRQLGAWSAIESMRLTPYTGLETWEAGMAERVHFDCQEIGADHLGYMIENRIVQIALWERFQALKVSVLEWCDWELQGRENDVRIRCGDQTIFGKLLIGADGANSQVRQQVGIGISGWDYRQYCLSINIKLDEPAPPLTWQEFHPSGPRALLPLFDSYAALIWYDQCSQVNQLKKLSAQSLKLRIKQDFPPLSGDFEVLNCSSFPLTRRHAHHYFSGRIVLAGDAAHTIHPLAGQGVNIGFKDVTRLLQLCEKYGLKHHPKEWLGQYQRQRKLDNLMMQSTMDLFYKAFSSENACIGQLRRLGLLAAQHGGLVKRQALRYAVGLGR